MYRIVLFIISAVNTVLVSADTYTVKIDTVHHVNLVDTRFLSFTIDPKYLFSTNGKFNSKECICMASSLAPAYLRIAGPSTALMTYHNSSIAIQEDPADFEPKRSRFQNIFSDNLARIDQALHRRGREELSYKKRRNEVKEEGRFKRNHERLEVSHGDWKRFVQWASSTGFELVFAVNNEEKTGAGLWDPNRAIDILTVAERARVGDIFWQLGYECTNQSIEEYLNDLETLRVITETFPQGRAGRWKVVGGDVSPCLHEDSKSDFKDYVTLSTDMMDAVLLNGNSSTVELERMSERDRLKLLKLLSRSSTPLWLTERRLDGDGPLTEMSSAADWLTSLGHAATNGFSVHFKELEEEEMYQPTLSFYMALLFKNLVGEKVLRVNMEPERAIMFAHCTSLRHKAVPGAVTLYGVNMDDEPARFSVKLAHREEGGDVMQFVLGNDKSGNIVVNGKAMYHEGDLKPVVKRVRPFKTLLINLPAKSFGFWVLANTKVEACFSDEKYSENENVDDAVSISEETEIEDLKSKRSINVQDFEEYTDSDGISVDFRDENDVTEELMNTDLQLRVNEINKDLSKVEEIFNIKPKRDMRTKRHIENINRKRKLIKQSLKNKNSKSEPEPKPRRLLGNLLQSKKHNITKLLRSDILRKLPRLNKNKLSKRQSDVKPKKVVLKRKENTSLAKNKINKENTFTVKENKINLENKRVPKPPSNEKGNNDQSPQQSQDSIVEEKVRTRRNTKDQVDLSAESEIDINGKDHEKLWKMLHKIHKQFKDFSDENEEYVDEIDTEEHVDTKGDKEVDVDVADDTNFIKSTMHNLLRVLSDLNKNLNRFFNGMKLLD